MDKGAHFFKCDFQVHTPRDINWQGQRPSDDAGRKNYAENFVKKCRELGLHAVAITDHHDFSFFPIIKTAALHEVDDKGIPIEEHKKLVVFPGVELTLSTPPCQAILIIDADYPEAHLNQILHLFGITPSTLSEPTTIPTVPISNTNVNGFEELYEKLNSISILNGKFIVLPNLSEGGRHTLLRAGNSEHYKKMPCVGGYVDGNVTQLGTGNKNIINGIAREYGNKSVAVFQTSDARQSDFATLGTSTSWVKWAVPTAEALRQACLAKESRLSNELPLFPTIYISKIDVTNCKFLGSFSLEFNNQYNGLIGGRGSGKSTILEYLRWGLCDQTSLLEDSDELTEINKRRKLLIEKTLIPFNGEVRITFNLNGINHIVKRNSTNNEISLKIGDSEFQLVKEEELRQIMPIQAYSQKQLSSVGVRTDELKRFIQQPIINQLSDLRFQISDNSKRTRVAYNNSIRKRELQNEVDQITIEFKSLSDQVQNLRNGLTGVSEEDQKIIGKKQKVDTEQNFINLSKGELNTIASKISELATALQKYPEKVLLDGLENQDLIANIDKARTSKFLEISKLVGELRATLSPEGTVELRALFAKWEEAKNDFEGKYETIKSKTASNQHQLTEITRIEGRLKDLGNSINERNAVLKDLGNPEAELIDLRQQWFDLHNNKLALLNRQSQTFSSLSNGLIKAEISKNIDTHPLKSQLTTALSGSRIREDRIEQLCNHIKNSENPIAAWGDVLNELKALSEVKIGSSKQIEIPESRILLSCEFSEVNITKMIEVLSPKSWLEISLTEIEFTPKFLYTTNNELGDTIPFSEASAGQQATALLTVLLNQSGVPLIIDQPEDDIDNKAIDDIIKLIWKAKQNRQLIFTSHNANLVVNGDSELVIACDYRDSSSQTRGIIKVEGAIDSKPVRDEITSVMEGGEKAFVLRKSKYGF
jgi:chromosome segregation protein